MKKAKEFNQVEVRNLKKAPENAGADIKLYFEPYEDCVKLGVGTMYDDHCAFTWLLNQVEYDPSLFSTELTSIEVLSDIDKIYLTKKDIVIEAIYTHQTGDKFIADKNFVENLFVIKKQIWSDNGFVGWVSCIPEFSPYKETKIGEIRTEFLNKIWNIPDNLEWYEEGHAESGIEPTNSLELGYLGSKFYFINPEKLENEINEKYEYILKADKYEDWMWDLAQFEARVDGRYDVVEKVYQLKYEADKDFYDKAVKERIEELKNIKLYEVGFDDLPLKSFSWDYVAKYTPYIEEYEKLQKEYEKIYNDLIIVESKAGFFIANKKDKIWNVKVPDDKKGLFIGRKGANIKALANEYKVRINLKE